MAPPRIKFCGFTRDTDVRVAVDLGVDAIGFNLARGPRRLEADQARALAALCPPLVTPVLLLIDRTLDETLDLLLRTRCTAVQLHGNEPPDLAERLRTRVPVIKAFAIASAEDVGRVHGYPADAYLLDAKVPGLAGGTGTTWDWSVLKAAGLNRPVILAGGLTPANVALAVSTVRPWAVDTASGIESAPGIKDPDHMAAFVRALRSG